MHIAQGNWLPEEAKRSTWRELVAVGRVLMSVAEKLCSMKVRWFTDSNSESRELQVPFVSRGPESVHSMCSQ